MIVTPPSTSSKLPLADFYAVRGVTASGRIQPIPWLGPNRYLSYPATL